jgi:arabinogalactan oligomer/maltooligosaccharide transport system permease protein
MSAQPVGGQRSITGANLRAWKRRDTGSDRVRIPLRRQLILQTLCVFVALTVLFPVMWVLSLALDPRDLLRPDGLNLIPPGASLDNFRAAIEQPSQVDVSFWTLAFNSLLLATTTAAFSVLIGVFAAYVFSRVHFRGRQVLMLAVLAVLMLPTVATIVPLFILLGQIRVGDVILRSTLAGVAFAVVSGLLPFAIWNLKGYLDTIPKDLEEAAAVDGATRHQSFTKVVLPLAVPALAVTAFLGFVGGWTEYYFSVTFLRDPSTFTLSVALNGMVGAFATETPWGKFCAFAILFALPVSVVYAIFQRWIIGGLAVGGVKG